MKVLGIDPGFGRCGYAVLEKTQKKTELVSCGTIVTDPKTPYVDRLVELAADMQTILDRCNPDIVSVEDLFFVQNITTGIQVAQARGIILLLAAQKGCEVVAPKPVEIKSCLTGNGKASKAEMKKMVQAMFSLKKSPKIDDAADAIGAAFWAFQNAKIR